MGFLDRLLIEAGHERQDALTRSHPYSALIDVSDLGEGHVHVKVGDMDGSGDAPGVQIELDHPFLSEAAAMAMTAREAEALGRALLRAADSIPPSERLRPLRSRLTKQRSSKVEAKSQ